MSLSHPTRASTQARSTAVVRDFGIGEALVCISEHGVPCKAASISYCLLVGAALYPFTLSFFHSPQREKSVRGGRRGYCRLLQKLTLQERKIKLDMFEMKGEGGRELIGGTRQR